MSTWVIKRDIRLEYEIEADTYEAAIEQFSSALDDKVERDLLRRTVLDNWTVLGRLPE